MSDKFKSQVQQNSSKRGLLENRLEENGLSEQKNVAEKPSPAEQRNPKGTAKTAAPAALNKAGTATTAAADAPSTVEVSEKTPARTRAKENLMGVMIYFDGQSFDKFSDMLNEGKKHAKGKLNLTLQQSELISLMTAHFHHLFINDKSDFFDQITSIVAKRKQSE